MCCTYFEPTTHLTRILENQELFLENLCPSLKHCASLSYRPTRLNYLILPFPKVGRDWQGLSKEGRVCLLGSNNKIGCKYSRNFTPSDKEMEIRRTTAEKI